MNRTLADRLRIYAITPDGWSRRYDVKARLYEAAQAGLTCVQFRDKSPGLSAVERRELGRRVVQAAREAGLLVLINDDPHLACMLDADGAHVGSADMEISAARFVLGSDRILGASAATPERARAAVACGADYLGVGAIFDATPTKPDASAARGTGVLRTLREDPALAAVPLVAIGGITADNARACIEAGASGVAAIRAILGEVDLSRAVRAFDEATRAPRVPTWV